MPPLVGNAISSQRCLGEEEVLDAIVVVLLHGKIQFVEDRSSSSVSTGLPPLRCFSLIAFLSLRMLVVEISVS
jgi:hypothetical protein